MATTNQVREAHKLLDVWMRNKGLYADEVQMVRSLLPELPKQKTLEEITEHVYDAWTRTNYNEWAGNIDNPIILLEEWLVELHVQLEGLTEESTKAPTLPAGMRLAEHEELGRVVVSPSKDREGDYAVFYLHSDHVWGAYLRYVNSSDLTFIDAEPAKPAHPEFLETEADYRDAPEGTVAARDGWLSWIKEGANYWTCSVDAVEDCSMTQSQPRRILRWGWGE